MQTIDLSPIIAQTFTTTIENDRYEISLYQSANGLLLCDLSRNEAAILSGSRVIINDFIMPYPTSFLGHGNFMLSSPSDNLPNYSQFGVTQTFVYFEIAEMQAVLAGML